MAAILCNNYWLPCWFNSDTYIGPDTESRLQLQLMGSQWGCSVTSRPTSTPVVDVHSQSTMLTGHQLPSSCTHSAVEYPVTWSSFNEWKGSYFCLCRPTVVCKLKVLERLFSMFIGLVIVKLSQSCYRVDLNA